MTTAAELPPELKQLLASHSLQFSPFYDGYLSDHAPMGSLALHGLGKPAESVVSWYERYTRRLMPYDSAPSGYRRLFESAIEILRRRSPDEVLSAELPALISGWARNAYHPLIRLAYGYRFGIHNEMAAGLAYLHWCGPERTLERMAWNPASASNAIPAGRAFQAAAACTRPRDGRFDRRLEQVIGDEAFERIPLPAGDVLRRVSRLALNVFDTTHDFFALHLVTGAHAFRLLYPFAGPQRAQFFSLGILAGYAAIGAPPLRVDDSDATPPEPGKQHPDALLNAIPGDDDHDIKLAFSCREQAEAFGDPGYTRVAFDYLARG